MNVIAVHRTSKPHELAREINKLTDGVARDEKLAGERLLTLKGTKPLPAAVMTVEALMYSLRERGTRALAEPATRRRLSKCSDEQVIEVGKRLRHLKPHIGRGPWSADEIRELFRAMP